MKYTRQQLLEAIRFWQNELANMNENNSSKDTNRYLFMITGAPGAGKSTLAKKLVAKAPKYINPIEDICEADDYFYMIGKGKYAFDPSKLRFAHEWCQNKAKAAMEAGKNLIVSNTNIMPAHRKIYFDLAKKHGYRIVFIHLTTQYGSVHNVPDEVVNRMLSSYKGLDAYEQSLVVDDEDMTWQLAELLHEVGL